MSKDQYVEGVCHVSSRSSHIRYYHKRCLVLERCRTTPLFALWYEFPKTLAITVHATTQELGCLEFQAHFLISPQKTAQESLLNL